MSQTNARPNPLRFSRPDFNRLAAALAVALAIHLGGYYAYKSGLAQRWLEKIHLPHWLAKAQQKLIIPLAPKIPAEREIPLMFVEVNPASAVTAAPKNAKYYSDKSSVAANPDADKEAIAPKISGKQERITKTEDTQRSKAFPLQPAAPPAPQTPPPQPAQPQAEAKKSQTPGDLAFAKPETVLREAEALQPVPPQPKPRTVIEALSRPQNSAIAGERMKQEGGVQHRAQLAALDVAGTSFGAYDAALIAAIQSHWYDLLDAQNLSRPTGRVTLLFHLNDDGSITGMTVEENDVGELLGALCQRAVRDPAPYAPWPSDMRRKISATFRELRFTFYYN